MAFNEWFLVTKPKVVANEILLRNPDHCYAGTIDRLCEIKGEPHVVDFKTGQYIWTEYELRLSAYDDGNLYLPDGLNLTSMMPYLELKADFHIVESHLLSPYSFGIQSGELQCSRHRENNRILR